MRLPPQQSSHTKSQLLVWTQLDPEDPDLISDFICDGFLIWWHHWEVIEHLSWVLEGESQSLRECHYGFICLAPGSPVPSLLCFLTS